MTNASLFKQAHALTRATLQAGDDYRATFGLCYKELLSARPMIVTRYSRTASMANQHNATCEAIGYQSPRQPIGYYKPSRFDFKAILTAIAFVLAAVVMISLV